MDRIIVGIASIKRRRNSLKRVIEALREQTIKPDVIYVYLNDYTYEEIPNFLKKTNIKVFTGDISGDRGDAGKYFCVSEESGFYLSVDDDLNYPPTYIEHMVTQIEAYGRKCVVAQHGSVLHQPVENFFKDRRIYNFKKHLPNDVRVHLPGTGVTAFHTDTIKLSINDFPIPNMADIWFGLQAQRQNIAIVVLKHNPRWVGVLPHTADGSIFHETHQDPEIIKRNTDIVNRISEWKIN